ncbi:hypothetical protein DPMN_114193 [Dreissena polymorpha]|uniref:Uncharacterized protein n=1 Tax=Dreissena polymorpha TaxID=45954 RepID=A0A9D4QS82_DREPO|nr:hypothetical protein DPMN_114193 [Dreissena polymorpha]
MAKRKEMKRLDLMDILNCKVGPFTDSGKCEKCLVNGSLNKVAKLQKIKLEVQLPKERSKLLHRVDSIFTI